MLQAMGSQSDMTERVNWTDAEYIMQNAELDEAQAGIKIARRNINKLRYADDTTLMAESKEELKSLLMKVKEESEKAGLKLNIQKMNFMASSSITSWQVDGKQWKQWQTLFSWATESLQMVTCSHEIKQHLLLGRKSMTNLDGIWKSRDITLPTGAYSQSYGFSSSHVWMWELDYKESWALMN